MAGSLPNIILKRFAARSLSKPLGGSLCNYGLRFLTSATNDPDTHDDFKPANKLETHDDFKPAIKLGTDFKPANKLENSGVSLKDLVEQDVKENPVMIYMKGIPELPLCGFSSLAVKILQLYDVPFGARDVLEDAELKSAVKAFSNWPTFPQIFIKGEFLGGSDIILNMHQSGELKDLLKDVTSKK
ncbi:monothiol glutaredoxin-S15, mitochondrial isoform X2 [Neltuma alba]|uniref:monothiol glutaredoxin-S15, mitochondrial isoform X2 n=1 Tax=Neltuma alba TaxID=207710 RepID=UPI0010A4554A|nr:monothiol glutaredoxin-S15, mitochondrial-like isoform X2 [Prosopis alba]